MSGILIHLMATATLLSETWPWYVIRVAGIVAVALTFLLMLSGIGMVTGATYRFMSPLKAWVVHRALGIALLVSGLLHVGFLLIDSFRPYSLADVLVPFAVKYEHSRVGGLSVGSLYNATGIISMYLMLLVIITSLLIIETKKRFWRWTHYLSYILMVLVFFHTLFLGTDFKHGLVRTLWIIIGLVLTVGTLSRLRRAGTTA